MNEKDETYEPSLYLKQETKKNTAKLRDNSAQGEGGAPVALAGPPPGVSAGKCHANSPG